MTCDAGPILRRVACVATALGLVFGSAPGLVGPPQAQAAELTIRLCGMEPRVGDLRIAVFSEAQAATFGDPEADDFVAEVIMSLADADPSPVLRTTIPSLKPGRYAVRVSHDENANGRIDFGRIVGTPQEGFGYSRNQRARVRAVTFDEAAITLGDEPKTIEVRVVSWSLTGGDTSPCPP